MKIIKCLPVLFLLVVSKLAIAGYGGIIYINNETPFVLERGKVIVTNWIDQFSTPSTIESEDTKGIYLEVSRNNDFSASALVYYLVKCPDGQIDGFRLKVRFTGNPHYSIMPVELTQDNQETHCINISGNQPAWWVWNEKIPSIPPATLVIRQQ